MAGEPQRKDGETVSVTAVSQDSMLRIRVSLEGDTPGLPESRLSVDAFGKPLRALLVALRRIASALAKQALDDPAYGRAGGNYAAQAKRIDLQLENLRHNSPLELDFVCSMAEPIVGQVPLFKNGLLERAADELLSAIDAEGHGTIQNAAVKNYLRSLPAGIRHQRYTLNIRNRTRTVELGDLALAEIPAGMPYLDQISGTIAGVGFEPGPTEVRIQTHGAVRGYAASSEQVEEAIRNRSEPVEAMLLREGGRDRILWLQAGDQMSRRAPFSEAVAYLTRTWDGLLKRLAQ